MKNILLIGLLLATLSLNLQADAVQDPDSQSKPSKKCIEFAQEAYKVMQKRQQASSNPMEVAMIAGTTAPIIDYDTMLMVINSAFEVQKYSSKEDKEAASLRYKNSAMDYCRKHFE